MADPFERFAGLEPLPYLDSPASLPVYSDLDAYFARLETADPSMYEVLFAGRAWRRRYGRSIWSRCSSISTRGARAYRLSRSDGAQAVPISGTTLRCDERATPNCSTTAGTDAVGMGRE